MMHITPMRDKLAIEDQRMDFGRSAGQQIRWVSVALLVEHAHSRVHEIPRKACGECINIFRRLVLQLASMPMT